MSDAKQAVLITTDKRGVFFGYLVGEATEKEVTITRARNCSYWARSMRGFLGLAEQGPNSECRIGPPVETLRLFGITSVATVSANATKAWEAAPWG